MNKLFFILVCSLFSVSLLAQDSDSTQVTTTDSSQTAAGSTINRTSNRTVHVDVANIIGVMPELITTLTTVFRKKDKFNLPASQTIICFKNKSKSTVIVLLKNTNNQAETIEPIMIEPKKKGQFLGLSPGIYRYQVYENNNLKAESEVFIEEYDEQTISL